MGNIHVIADGALLITDGVIRHAGPSRRLERLEEAKRADTMDASGRVVMPGFVDSFTQLLCGPPGISGERAGEGFAGAARTFRSWSAQRLELEGRKRLRQFVRFGTTTLTGASGYALDEETELRSLRALDRLREAPIDLSSQLYLTARAWLRAGANPFETLEALALGVLPAAHGKRLLQGVTIDDGFPLDAIEGYLACAARLGLRGWVETAHAAVDFACRTAGVEAVMGLEEIGAAQIERLGNAAAGGGPTAVLVPGRTFHSGSSGHGRYAPARALIDAGAAVALATGFDNLASPTASMPMVMALACTQMGMTAEEALTAATVNAAHALGLGSRVGTLQFGMQADLLVMDCGDYREIPLYFGMNPVAMVMRRGEFLFPRLESADARDSPVPLHARADRMRS